MRAIAVARIVANRRVETLDALGEARSVQQLLLARLQSLRDVTAIARMPSLRLLKIEDCPNVESILPLSELTSLEGYGSRRRRA